MRRGLVAVGIGVVLVGATFLGTVLTLPSPPSEIASESFTVPTVVHNDPQQASVDPPPARTGTVTVFWVSEAPVHVGLYTSAPCEANGTNCTHGWMVKSWAQNYSGNWTSRATIGLPVYLLVVNNGSVPTTVTGTVFVSYVPSGGYLPTLSTVALYTGTAFLFVLAGVLLFLGFFLPSGAYALPPVRPPPPEELKRLQDVPDDDEPS